MNMADGCASVVLAGFITFLLYYLLSWITTGKRKVIKKIQGKPNEPIECNIKDAVSSIGCVAHVVLRTLLETIHPVGMLLGCCWDV